MLCIQIAKRELTKDVAASFLAIKQLVVQRRLKPSPLASCWVLWQPSFSKHRLHTKTVESGIWREHVRNAVRFIIIYHILSISVYTSRCSLEIDV